MESLTGIGSGQAPLAQCVALAQRPAVRQGWLNCQRLVIDEISMVEADLFDKLEAVARSVCAARAGFWWFSIWNLATSASKVPHAPMQSCPATGQAFWRDPAHHLWGLPTAATCNQGIPAPEVLLSGQELEKVCPSDSGADRSVEAGRPELHLSAASCQAGKVRPGEQRRGKSASWSHRRWSLSEHWDSVSSKVGSPSPSTCPGAE